MGMAWEFVPGTAPGVTLQCIGVWSLLCFKDLYWFYLAVGTLRPCSWRSVENNHSINRQAPQDAASTIQSSSFRPPPAPAVNPLPAPGSTPEAVGRQSASRPRVFAVGSRWGEIAVARGTACADTARRRPPHVLRTPAPRRAAAPGLLVARVCSACPWPAPWGGACPCCAAGSRAVRFFSWF